MKRKIKFLFAFRFVLILNILLLSCAPEIIDFKNWENFSKEILNLQAEYLPIQKKVKLTWTEVDFPCEYISVFRAVGVSQDSALRLSKLSAPIAQISSSSVEYFDIPDVEMGEYYYWVKPIFRDSTFQIITGNSSNIAPVYVGRKISFNINQNALFTDSNYCKLYLKDSLNELQEVRITQIASQNGVPQFDTTDKYNSRTGFTDFSPSTWPITWRLSDGLGEKTIWAKAIYKNGVDTIILKDVIQTRPINIDLSITNNPDSLIKTTLAANNLFIFSQPFLKFKIRLYGTKVHSSVKYQLSAPLNYVYYIQTSNEIKTDSIEQDLKLNKDGQIDESQEYVIKLDTLDGGIFYTQLQSSTDTSKISLGAKQNADTFWNTGGFDLQGKKEFRFKVIFTHQNFNAQIPIILGYDGDKISFKTAYDRYLPCLQFSNVPNEYINNGSIIEKPFTLSLRHDNSSPKKDPSLFDSSKVKITNVNLLIARKPENWNNRSSFQTILNENRSRLIPLAIPVPNNRLFDLSWPEIDPSSWQSGEYIMGVVVRDEFGREGFATLISKNKESDSNPWVVTVNTGK